MDSQSQVDAAFFEMVHRLRESSQEGDDDRRGNDRHTFRCLQFIAPVEHHGRPEPGDFVLRQVNDLSAGGFSFFTPQEPGTSHVIVALGKPPFKFFTAEVRHSTATVVDEQTQYLVGCRLQERLQGGEGLCPDISEYDTWPPRAATK